MAKRPVSLTVLRILTLLVLLNPIYLVAQTDAHWYFGRKAALNFNTTGNQNGPAVLSNSVMTTAEAAAAISDNNGNLLFYTNGVQVFNRNHQVMLNGDGLRGDASACQIAVVPQPGSNTIFYIFTTDAFENDFLAGYYYSVVDMSGDGGMGDVVSKNNLLWSSCSERVTAIRHANGTDVWILTNDENSNIFRAWLLTCNGFNATNPVVSTIGEVMNQNPLMNVGVMKGSPDGRFLCQTHFPFTDANTGAPNFAQLFDFNNATGVISNARKISYPSTHYNHCEFSPDSKQLYLTRKNNKQLDQLDISLPGLTDILNSRQSFPTGNAYYDIQLAMDERIYLTQGSIQLARINFPNERGAACNFQANAVNISPGTVSVGLPSHINDIVGSNNQGNGFSYTILDSCRGRVQFNANTTLTGHIHWLWEFGENPSSTLQNPLHVFANPGDAYTVKLTITAAGSCGRIVRSRIIRPAGTGKPVAGFTYKFICDSNYVRFTNTSLDTIAPNIGFTWDFGDGNSSSLSNPVHSYTLDGNYTVKLKINTGNPCKNDSISIPISFTRFSISITPDQSINYGQTVSLTTNVPADSYDWSPGKWLSDSTIRNPVAIPYDNISYILIARNGNCSATDTVNITVIQNDFLYVPSGFTPNSDGKNDQFMPLINGRYLLKEFSIFNRNGERVYSTSNRGEGWNGRIRGQLQTSGVFVWVLNAVSPDGTPVQRKGTLTLIR